MEQLRSDHHQNKNLLVHAGRYREPVRGRDDVYDRAGNPSMYDTVCSGNGHDRSCSDNDTSAERRPGETRGGTGKSLIHVPAGRFGV